MSNDVASFVARCRRDPAICCPVKALFKAFGQALPADKRSAWSRSNFLFELARGGFALGQVGNSDIIVGLAPPSGGWQVINSRLHFAECAA